MNAASRTSWLVRAAVASALLVLAALLVWGRVENRTPTQAQLSAARLAPKGAPPLGEANPALVALGRKIFFDSNLSEPPGTSCASCHEPAHAFSGTNGSSNGLAQGSRPGHFASRNTPSILYLKYVRRFHYHWEEDMPLPDAFGGFFWDGRVDSISALVRQPLLNPDEMNNQDLTQIAAKLNRASYAREFRNVFAAAGRDPEPVVTAAGAALEAYLFSPAMAPFSSRFDAYVRGETHLSDTEMRGLALFKDREKGNCARCHKVDDGSSDSARSLFTDYGFEVVGVPRNRRALPGAPEHPDLGLCERKGASKTAKEERFCGAFRTPSLRNVAVRTSFMHNGVFRNLRDVVAFYATRDTAPEHWYPAQRFDDLPEEYRPNVNTDFAPYSTVGAVPRLDDGDIDALVAFLETLTDAQFQVAVREAPGAFDRRLAERR
jgi:cytochrome c peroxidase